jgi:dihydroxy-acid dehydratase
MLEMGIRDMVRVCDGRMSGTAYGTVVLHVAPEAAAGGLLAVIQDGDPIVLDAPRGLLQLDVTEEELIRRTPAPTVTRAFASPDRGWQRLYVEHVQQADTGADLDFLVGASGPGVARESH